MSSKLQLEVLQPSDLEYPNVWKVLDLRETASQWEINRRIEYLTHYGDSMKVLQLQKISRLLKDEVGLSIFRNCTDFQGAEGLKRKWDLFDAYKNATGTQETTMNDPDSDIILPPQQIGIVGEIAKRTSFSPKEVSDSLERAARAWRRQQEAQTPRLENQREENVIIPVAGAPEMPGNLPNRQFNQMQKKGQNENGQGYSGNPKKAKKN